MTAVSAAPTARTLTPRIALWAGLTAQLFCAPALWGHQSIGEGLLLERYSPRYTLALGLHLLLALAWLAAALRHAPITRRLERLPAGARYGLLVAGGLAAFALWLLPVETVLQQYFTLNGLLASFMLIITLPDAPPRFRRWPLAALVFLLLVLIPLYIGAVSDRRFEPDEAFWAEFTEAVFSAGGLYSRTHLWPPEVITPGQGWLNVGFGWLLHTFGFHLIIGRTLQFASYLVAFVGIAALAWRLYGRTAALLAAGVAVLSQGFIPVVEYRPNLQMHAFATFMTLVAAQARRSSRRARWDFGCGLLATLSMQAHASGMIFTGAFFLVYLGEFLWPSYRRRQAAPLWPLLAFSLGAGLGAGIYFVFNVLPVGGLEAYLARLIAERSGRSHPLPFLRALLEWRSVLEGFLFAAGLVYILWRRNESDRFLLGVLAALALVSVFLDTQGYRSTFSVFLVITVGVLAADGLRAANQPPDASRRAALGTAALFAALLAQMVGMFLISPWTLTFYRTGQTPPFLYEAIGPVLEPYLRPGEKIVSTHQLIWSFPRADLVSHAAGGMSVGRGVSAAEIEVWDQVRPDVIVYIENEMHFDPGLQMYMERENFGVCDRLEFMEHAVEIYRRGC